MPPLPPPPPPIALSPSSLKTLRVFCGLWWVVWPPLCSHTRLLCAASEDVPGAFAALASTPWTPEAAPLAASLVGEPALEADI